MRTGGKHTLQRPKSASGTVVLVTQAAGFNFEVELELTGKLEVLLQVLKFRAWPGLLPRRRPRLAKPLESLAFT